MLNKYSVSQTCVQALSWYIPAVWERHEALSVCKHTRQARKFAAQLFNKQLLCLLRDKPKMCIMTAQQ